MSEKKNKNTKKYNIFSTIWIILMLMLTFCNLFVWNLTVVRGTSMYPTLKDGQWLVMEKVTNPENYKRGDIIVYKEENRLLIKRLIALPGESIQIINNDIYINDNKIEDYVDIVIENYGCLTEKIVLKENEYFFLGDNRNNSADCRISGPINVENIKGKIIFK